MHTESAKNHWEKIYRNKDLKEVSWYQATPTTSLDFLAQFQISRKAKIIDIGGGDSLLVDHLLDLGYEDVTVLDISQVAIDKARQRLGARANQVKWVVSDVTTFTSDEKYDFWHDRAAFHFLTTGEAIDGYLEVVQQNLNPTGVLVVGTFSEQGPTKCSGLEIKQYSEVSLAEQFNRFFEKIRCISVDHRTPFDTIQNFIFCSFRKYQIQ